MGSQLNSHSGGIVQQWWGAGLELIAVWHKCRNETYENNKQLNEYMYRTSWIQCRTGALYQLVYVTNKKVTPTTVECDICTSWQSGTGNIIVAISSFCGMMIPTNHKWIQHVNVWKKQFKWENQKKSRQHQHQKKRSNFLKVCQLWELEPEKLTTEFPDVGKKCQDNICQFKENPIWNGPEYWWKMSRKKLLNSLNMWHFKLCALLIYKEYEFIYEVLSYSHS